MKLTVVACPCQNPVPHRKFEAENGDKSDGFFSLAEGRYILQALKDGGVMAETEVVEANAQLATSGLPEFVSLSDDDIAVLAANIIAAVAPIEYDEEIFQFAKRAGISPADEKRVRDKIQETRKVS